MSRCTAKSKRSKEQCLKWAVKGRTTCHMHGGTSNGPIKQSRKEKISFSSFTWLTSEDFEKMKTHLLSPFPISFYLRPGDNFILNFLYYYQLLAGPETPEKKEVITLLQCCAYDPHPKIQSIRQFLLKLVTNPKQMPELQEIITTGEKGIKDLREFLENLPLYRISRISRFSEIFLRKTRDNNWSIKRPLESSLIHREEVKISQMPLRCDKEELSEILIKKGCLLLQDYQHIHEQKIENLESLKAVFSSIPSDSPCVQRASHRIIEGIKEMQKELSSKEAKHSYCINLDKKSRTELLNQLKLHCSLQKAEMLLQKKEIYTYLEIESPLLKAEQLSGLLPTFTFHEILLVAITDDDTEICKAVPNKQPHVVKDYVTRYLLAATQKQHYERSIKHLNDLNKAIENKEETAVASHKLILSLLAERAYSTTEDFPNPVGASNWIFSKLSVVESS